MTPHHLQGEGVTPVRGRLCSVGFDSSVSAQSPSWEYPSLLVNFSFLCLCLDCPSVHNALTSFSVWETPIWFLRPSSRVPLLSLWKMAKIFNNWSFGGLWAIRTDAMENSWNGLALMHRQLTSGFIYPSRVDHPSFVPLLGAHGGPHYSPCSHSTNI